MEEVWKDIPDTNYQVSNTGRVKNKKTTNVLKNSPSTTGYARVSLSNGSKSNPTIAFPHRLVAELFIPNPDNKPQVNHIDSDRMNPHVDNLEWVTAKENTRHAINSGRFDPLPMSRKAVAASNAVTSVKTTLIDETGKKLEFASRSECARYLDVPSTRISRFIVKNKTVKGYTIV